MFSTFCLGQFIITIGSSSPFIPSYDSNSLAFLQRGYQLVHIIVPPQNQYEDLTQKQSHYLGLLLGPVSSCSTPVKEREISSEDLALIKLQLFLVTRKGRQPQLRGCVFCRSENVAQVWSTFASTEVDLDPIWNYNPEVFFSIPHYTSEQHNSIDTPPPWLATLLRPCKTVLKPHQLSALKSLLNNECTNNKTALALWGHNNNAWIQNISNEEVNTLLIADPESTRPRGSILADDMGLGKTLTTLALILATSSQGRHFRQADPTCQSCSTLVICPPSTLLTWKHEIGKHFDKNSITYKVFHGSKQTHLELENLQSAMVVLTTYNMIGKSGNENCPNVLTVGSLELCWFRIVLDEAQ
jgi:hypothetical protein